MGIAKNTILLLIKIYKWTLSPALETLFGKGCVFTPTCSRYAEESIKKFGIIRGIGLSLRRLSRCHPGMGAAYDPVQ